MLKLRVMNSTGAAKTELVDVATTFADVLDNPAFNGLLVGNQFALNGQFISEAEFNKPLTELGATTEGTNILSAVKAANGAC